MLLPQCGMETPRKTLNHAYRLPRVRPPHGDGAAKAYDPDGKRGTMFPIVLRREIIILLAAKAALLALLYFLFFSPSHRPAVTPDALRAHVMGE
jgi:hypothetical protein